MLSSSSTGECSQNVPIRDKNNKNNTYNKKVLRCVKSLYIVYYYCDQPGSI
jgi:hypothetical protein